MFELLGFGLEAEEDFVAAEGTGGPGGIVVGDEGSSFGGEVTDNNKKQAEKRKGRSGRTGDEDGAGNLSKAEAKTVAAAEKDAIKDRTAEAMRMLAEEESERKLENASYERGRDRARERMLEAANLEVQAAMENR